jgi:hypothetical protein
MTMTGGFMFVTDPYTPLHPYAGMMLYGGIATVGPMTAPHPKYPWHPPHPKLYAWYPWHDPKQLYPEQLYPVHPRQELRWPNSPPPPCRTPADP